VFHILLCATPLRAVCLHLDAPLRLANGQRQRRVV